MLDILLVTLVLIVNGFLFTIWSTKGWDNKLIKFSLFVIVVVCVTKIVVDFGVV